jgi:hypothetical protein
MAYGEVQWIWAVFQYLAQSLEHGTVITVY